MSDFIQPMLASPVPWDKIQTKCKGYWMEPKLDGVRCIADVDHDSVRLTTRSGQDITAKLPFIVEQLKSMDDRFIIDGELGYTNDEMTVIDFNKTMRVIGSGVDEAIRKQDEYFDQTGHGMNFHVFDLLLGNDHWMMDRDNRARRSHLEAFADQHEFAQSYEGVTLIPRCSEWDEDYYNLIVESGGEGAILKNPNAYYLPGQRRANTWYKIKKYESIDVQILGYTDALPGKFEGQIGAISFGLMNGSYISPKTIVMGKCSGMDDATRLMLSHSPEAFIGKWIELRHFGKVGKDGEGYRFPQFLRFRPDRDQEPGVVAP